MSVMERVQGIEVGSRVGGNLRSGRTLVVLGAALVLLAPSVASAKLAKWNQARVTKLATQLSEAADAVYLKVLKTQPPAAGGAGFSSFYRFKDNVRVIKNSADYLATRLKAGDGREETYPTFRRMMTLVRDARENGRRMGIVPNDTLTAIDHAGDILRQIRPYYEDTAAPQPKPSKGEEEE